jgi:hypothetical protein
MACYPHAMTRRQPLQAQGTRVLAALGAALGGLLACSAPALEHGTAPEASASALPAAMPAAPAPAALSAASAPAVPLPPVASAASVASVPTPAAASTVVPPEAPESEQVPAALSPEHARGQCSGRSTLQTKGGEVRCYPYRCRAGRCLLSCQTREDCAGSRGPAEMAEHGWPLDCATSSATCYPLSPIHVRGH